MIIFEIKEPKNLFNRVWNDLYLLLFFNIGLIIGNFSFFTEYYLLIELFTLSLFIYKLFNKRTRQVHKLVLNDNNKILCIHFYHLLFFKTTYNISYELLSIQYKNKLYRRGVIPKTIELRENGKLIVEIKQKYNLGWTNEELDDIYTRLNKKE